MILNEVRGAGDPAFAAERRENAPDLGFKLITGQNTDRGLHAYAAHNGKGVGVFFKIEVVGHSRAFLPRMKQIDAKLGKVVGDFRDATVGMQTAKRTARVDVVDHPSEMRAYDLAPDPGAEHHILLRAPVVRNVYHINAEVDGAVCKGTGPFRLMAIDLVELIGVENEPHKLIFDPEDAVEILEESGRLHIAKTASFLVVGKGSLYFFV